MFLLVIIIIIFLYILYYKNINQYCKCYRLFKKNDFFNECGEKLNIYNNIHKNDKVLEIGGNKGSTSEIISDMLKTPSNLVVLEPSKKAYEILKIKAKNKGFSVFNGCLSKESLYKKYNYFWDYVKLTNKKTSEKIDTITFNELEKKFNIKFDTLVIDCENCYYRIFLDFPEIFNNINKILIEWDGEFMHDFLLEKNFILKDSYSHPILFNGIKTYIKENSVNNYKNNKYIN